MSAKIALILHFSCKTVCKRFAPWPAHVQGSSSAFQTFLAGTFHLKIEENYPSHARRPGTNKLHLTPPLVWALIVQTWIRTFHSDNKACGATNTGPGANQPEPNARSCFVLTVRNRRKGRAKHRTSSSHAEAPGQGQDDVRRNCERLVCFPRRSAADAAHCIPYLLSQLQLCRANGSSVALREPLTQRDSPLRQTLMSSVAFFPQCRSRLNFFGTLEQSENNPIFKLL